MPWIFFLIIFGIILSAGMIIFIKKENKKFKITRYDVPTQKVRKDFTMVVMADLHNYSYGKKNCHLLDAIVEENPDAIMIAGDMIEANTKADGSQTMEFLMALHEKYPIYYGLGNHERRVLDRKDYFQAQYRELSGFCERTGVCLLENRCIQLKEHNIAVYGLDLEKEYFRKIVRKSFSESHLEDLLGSTADKEFNLLLAHNPEHFREYAEWGADLVLSGHVHGGMIKVPFLGGVISPQLKLFPKYDGGEYIQGEKRMILSRGMGNHSIHIRLFNRAELLVVKLTREGM